MHAPTFFDAIPIGVPQDKVYRRLGYRKNATIIPTRQREEVEEYIADARSLIHLKGAAIRMSIRERSPAGIVLADNAAFESRQLTVFLRGCREVFLMGGTAGSDIMEAMEKDTVAQNLTRRVVLDAVASEMVDASLDWIMAYFNIELRRENKVLMQRRYSAGYGDFSLENQRAIYRLLELDRIGVTITANCILAPEKSVTAVTGVKR